MVYLHTKTREISAVSSVANSMRAGSSNAGSSSNKFAPSSSINRHIVWPFVPFTSVLTLIVLTLIFILARGKVADPDIWWHLHNAQYLIENHRLPRYDMYSFSVSGHAWMNHEWLAELPYYFAWRAMGFKGIDAITIFVLWLIYLGVLHLSYRACRNFKAAVLGTVCAVFLGWLSFGPRTILFGYLFLVVLLIILQNYREKNGAQLWLIPPLFCIWVNTHGSWSLGMIFFSIIIVTGLIPVNCGMVVGELWTPSQRNGLVAAWVASAAMLFMNPYGFRLVIYPLDLAFRQKTNVEHVAEWVSINFHDLRGKIVIAILIILLLSVLMRPRRWTLTETTIAIFALYSGLTYVRFLCLLGLVIAPVLAKTLDFVPPYRKDLDTPVVNTFVILLMVVGLIWYRPSEAQLQNRINDQYPTGAISYLRSHPPVGPIVNYYLWGGFINWENPNLKVFIDGRADIFDYNGVFTDYIKLLGLVHPNDILDKYHAQYVLFPPGEPLTYELQQSSKWKTVYSDRNSALLEHNE